MTYRHIYSLKSVLELGPTNQQADILTNRTLGFNVSTDTLLLHTYVYPAPVLHVNTDCTDTLMSLTAFHSIDKKIV